MDLNRFSASSPGRLLPIRVVETNDFAFVPAPLPPIWEFDGSLWPLVVEAKNQLGILEGNGRNLPNPAILLRPLTAREAIQSSRIEGTYATPRELFLFEMSPKQPTSSHDKSNQSLEVHNYAKALRAGMDSELPLSNRMLRELHQVLMTGVRGGDRTPGEFRRIAVAIGHSRRFVPPPLSELSECLDSFEKYLHTEHSPFDSLVDCFLVHYQFETIHPFQDGNGRVGRLLLALMIQRNCGMSKPWLYLSDYFERHRREYVDHLFDVSATGNWSPWIRFCLEGTVVQAKDAIFRCDRLRGLRERFLTQIGTGGGSARLITVVEQLFQDPFVGVAELADKLQVYYQTAQKYLERLADIGILEELPNHQPRTFFSPDIFRIAYEDLGSITE